MASTHRTAEVHTSDVERFYAIYDAAKGEPSAEVLQRDYIDGGTDGVRQFVPHRIISGEALARTIAQDRQVYDHARHCLDVLPSVAARLERVFHKLAKLDPDATFPPVTILIGRDNIGGTTGKSGVLIGLEVACRSDWMESDLSDRLLHLIAHEYGHIQQPPELDDDTIPTTVLRQSLIEGVAELMAWLTSGSVSNTHLAVWTKGREQEIEQKFLRDKGNTDLSAWLYNGPGEPDHPGDLGYWVGYRIAKAYYQKAKNKRAALRVLLKLEDPDAILAQSGWHPGVADGLQPHAGQFP
ncbi:DUF2268 domain-containing putative Zn-dependent protease [Novosphingobium album (ex Hu et al. 2023)]|uniref:DUF2268 domain-containing protein n=1 Tax=Novosphingobium album (ex Hu et al. 2023) TaxID=2930093 RepID=A0ABT0B2C2_9SPHN|nr:DUF2268 domain-containing putative Zn-dependent protease [Novosphingobium album (ex Hu et al. 2023)]MCJ2179179.1 DUF2268 domain-containing protein [Novosphingobium album (ex Hu et al. 2023)]